MTRCKECRRVTHGLTIALSLLIASLTSAASAAATCPVTFNGSEFLLAASQKGISLSSPQACSVVQPASNKFYAPPSRGCAILFENGTWLKSNAQFTALRGVGSFTSTKTEAGIIVQIATRGGFRLRDITITVPQKDCSKVQIDSVLK
jgi:hypothetical protein